MPTLGPFDIHPLCLGGNVFGWTADEKQSHAVLDAFADAGGTLIDTADVYSAWVDGHVGGESEAVIGRWLADRRPADVLIATKVGMRNGFKTLDARTITTAADGSLGRLGVEAIDLYYLHQDDPTTPLQVTLEALDGLVKAGKVRTIGLSNFSAERIDAVMDTCDTYGFVRPIALQPQYNLVERDYETELADTVARHGMVTLPFFALARGFLTGKYRSGAQDADSPRAGAAAAYLQDPKGARVLAALDEIAAGHGVPHAAVALAWLAAQPTVAAPIASARTTEQLRDILTPVTLSADEQDALTRAGQ